MIANPPTCQSYLTQFNLSELGILPPDFYAFFASLALSALYFTASRIRSYRNPISCIHRFNRNVREAWVDMIANNNKVDVLAVQTLRNSMMAASFMASTSILLIIGVLNISDKIGHWEHNELIGYTHDDFISRLWSIKIFFLLLDYAFTFFCFAMAIRFYNHAGFMINLLPNGSSNAVSLVQVRAYFNRAGSYYSYGTRGFLFSFPLIAWFFGPIALFSATLMLLVALYQIDRAPAFKN